MDIGYINTPQDWRDVFIMAFMVAGTLLFLVATFFTVVLGLLSIGAVSRARSTLKNSVQPALEAARDTAENVRGTVTFISDHAVTPIVRAYAAYAGARRFIAVIIRFAQPKRAS